MRSRNQREIFFINHQNLSCNAMRVKGIYKWGWDSDHLSSVVTNGSVVLGPYFLLEGSYTSVLHSILRLYSGLWSLSILSLRAWGHLHDLRNVKMDISSIQRSISEIPAQERQVLGMAVCTSPPVLLASSSVGSWVGWDLKNYLPSPCTPLVRFSGKVSWYSWVIQNRVDGKYWEGSWEEAFREAQVGLVCAGNVERKHPGGKNDRFTSWSYFRWCYSPWGIPIQLRTVPFL